MDRYKKKNLSIKLHMIGKLQTNKVKFAVDIFDYIHSVDNLKLAKKISDEIKKRNKKIKVFIQVNIGDEIQKSTMLLLLKSSKKKGRETKGYIA